MITVCMGLKTVGVYICATIAALESLTLFRWAYRYLVHYDQWGAYAFQQFIWSLLGILFLVGLMWALRRD